MNEITEYNQNHYDGLVDNFQVNFKIDTSQGKKAFQKEFETELKHFLADCYASMRIAQTAKIAPMNREDFNGVKKGVNAEYFCETVVGFPSRIGIITFEVGTIRFYKMGILIQKVIRK